MSTTEFTASDAEAAGWQIVHTADPSADSANAEIWRAEKYVNTPGRAGAFVDVQATTEEKLYAAIAQREQQFSVSTEGEVLLPAEDADEVDSSDEDTIKRVSDADYSRRSQNDVLTVLSDPDDPESDSEQKVIMGGEEVEESVLSEPAEPVSAGVGDEGDSGNDPELVQPAAGEATDASDSEQQSQVPDSEAASSDAISTNADDGLANAGQSQPEVTGPDTDAQAPAGAPNAQENESNTTETVEHAPSDHAA